MSSVMTVSGEVDAAELGVTLPHEHVFINIVREYRGEGLLNDYELMKQELGAFKAAGGKTIVDCTTNDIARDPKMLRAISEDTGVAIVMGCGYYRDPYINRSHIDERSVDELAEELVRDLTVGVGDSGVRAGVIGEIGADKWYVSAPEERSFRAAARAHHQTGITITTHAARWTVGLPQLEILTNEGVDPRRVIIGHCDMVPIPEYHLELARRGAYVEFDTIRGRDRLRSRGPREVGDEPGASRSSRQDSSLARYLSPIVASYLRRSRLRPDLPGFSPAPACRRPERR